MLLRWLKDPLLIKEVRTRVRAKSANIVLQFYLFALTAWISAMIVFQAIGYSSYEKGVGIFESLGYFQLAFLFGLAPLLTASAVTLEREQKTLDMLLAAPASPDRIVFSKLVASIFFFFILLFPSIPFLSIAYFYGGVGAASIAQFYAIAIAAMALGGMIGLFFSTAVKRTYVSVPLSGAVAGMAAFIFISLHDKDADSSRYFAFDPLFALKLCVQGEPAHHFGREIPFLAPFLIINGLLFLAMFFMSCEGLESEERRNYTRSRVAAILWIGAALWSLQGAASPPDAGMTAMWLAKFFGDYGFLAAFILSIAAVVQSGGRPSAGELKALSTGWTRRALSLDWWLGHKVISGTRTIFLFSVLIGLLLWAGLLMQGIAGAFAPVALLTALLFLAVGSLSLINRIISMLAKTAVEILSRVLTTVFLCVFLFHTIIQAMAIDGLFGCDATRPAISTVELVGPILPSVLLFFPLIGVSPKSILYPVVEAGALWWVILAFYSAIFGLLLLILWAVERWAIKKRRALEKGAMS